MGQAKQRREEIAALKAQGPRPQTKNILSFGAFYKDLDDDGISISIGTQFGLPRPVVEKFYQVIKYCVEQEQREFEQQNWQYFGDAATRDEAIANIWEQLTTNIVNYNITVFGTSQRPPKTRYTAMIDEDWIHAAFPVINNIWLLTNLGQIANDNYNGMSFMYGDKLAFA